jgi:hypothetical protein
LFPKYLTQAHDLCFLNHDILVELLRSGEEHRVFHMRTKFTDDIDKQKFEDAEDVFEWFNQTGRTKEHTETLKRSVFQSLLSDFLHFIYVSLKNSPQEKLNVTYALIRKPIQENLYLFETMAFDLDNFADYLTDNPLKLRVKNAGGIEGHEKRITKVLKLLGEEDRFDARYLAQLRYQKIDDGFDGICNRAMHLFTEHKAIRTESLNINMIFSGKQAKQRQWYFLYSRLPYILYYARRLIEYIFSTFTQTDPKYLANIERRVMASTLLWAPNVDPVYFSPEISKFVDATRARLTANCIAAGYGNPTIDDIRRMAELGE